MRQLHSSHFTHTHTRSFSVCAEGQGPPCVQHKDDTVRLLHALLGGRMMTMVATAARATKKDSYADVRVGHHRLIADRW